MNLKGLVEKSTAFSVPFSIRLIPELLVRFPIGYDTPHYVWAILNYDHLEVFPLFNGRFSPLAYFLLHVIHTATGLHPVVLMKVVPAVFFGLLGLMLHRYGEKSVNGRFGLVMSLLFALNLASLRLSWDLHKQVSALVFLVAALPLLKEEMNLKRGALLSGLIVLSVLAHQTAVIPLGLILLHRTLRTRQWKLLILLGVAALAVSPIMFRYASSSSLPQLSLLAVTNSLFFVVYTMPVLVALSLYTLYTGTGVQDDGVMPCFLVASFLFSLISRGGGFIYAGWRFAALMCIPLSFYAVKGAYKLYFTYYSKRVLTLGALFLLSAGYVAPMVTGNNSKLVFKCMPMNFSDNAFPWREQHELEALIKASRWCAANTPQGTIILTEDSMEDWVKIYSERRVHRWWGTQYVDALDWARSRGEAVYVVWWHIDEPDLNIVAEAFTPGSHLKVMKFAK